MITGAAQMDGAILVVARSTARCRRRVSTCCSPARSACRTSSSPSTRSTRWTIRNCSTRRDRSARPAHELGFPGDDIPIVRVSALKALQGEPADVGQTILEADGGPRHLHPDAAARIDKPFLMPIEDVFSISGRGTVVTGHVERGKVKVGDEVEIVGFTPTEKKIVTGVEMFRKLLDEGVAGDNIGVLLRGVEKDDVERGQVLAKPGRSRRTRSSRPKCTS